MLNSGNVGFENDLVKNMKNCTNYMKSLRQRRCTIRLRNKRVIVVIPKEADECQYYKTVSSIGHASKRRTRTIYIRLATKFEK